MNLPESALDQLFREAHTHTSWSDRQLADSDLKAVYDLAKMGPTSANSQPMRIVFVRSAEAKERLRPALAPGNVEKTMAAPATAIMAYDLEFYENFPETFPIRDMRSGFVGKPALIEETAFRNATLQSAYLIIAARALGFDCGPMSGFDRDAVDRAFFEGETIRSNFLCNIGHGDGKGAYPRNPRLDFDRACRIL